MIQVFEKLGQLVTKGLTYGKPHQTTDRGHSMSFQVLKKRCFLNSFYNMCVCVCVFLISRYVKGLMKYY